MKTIILILLTGCLCACVNYAPPATVQHRMDSIRLVKDSNFNRPERYKPLKP